MASSAAAAAAASVTIPAAAASLFALRRWAVVGDVTNTTKPAWRIVNRLQSHQYTVYRVNPQDKGTPGVYRSLSDIKQPIDVVDLVVGPKNSPPIINEAARLDVRHILLQPGTEAPEIVALVDSLKFTSYQGCVLKVLPDLTPAATASPPSKL